MWHVAQICFLKSSIHNMKNGNTNGMNKIMGARSYISAKQTKCSRVDCPYLWLGINSNELWKIISKLIVLDEK